MTHFSVAQEPHSRDFSRLPIGWQFGVCLYLAAFVIKISVVSMLVSSLFSAGDPSVSGFVIMGDFQLACVLTPYP